MWFIKFLKWYSGLLELLKLRKISKSKPKQWLVNIVKNEFLIVCKLFIVFCNVSIQLDIVLWLFAQISNKSFILVISTIATPELNKITLILSILSSKPIASR